MSSYEDKLCDAIEAIVDNAVNKANYDRTIQGTIVRCEDETVGKYKIKYQDGYFYAYASDINVKYTKNKVVYILVPGNNFKNQKTILGAAEKLGSDYAVTIEDEDMYEIIGSDCVLTIEGNEPFTLCTYETKEYQVYDRNKDEQFQRVKIDETGLAQYIAESSSIRIGATFQTNIDLQQRTRGNYGIQFDLVFQDNATESEVIRSYVLDIPNMLGEPYLFTEPSKQSVFFNVDSENFKRIERISLFCENFPYQEENKPSDIFITDITLECANILDDAALGGIAITLITKQGMYFTSSDGPQSSRSIEAQVRVKGRIVSDTSFIQYYWFRENPSVNSSSNLFNIYGGPGWECLNQFNILESSNETGELVSWVPGEKIYNVTKEQCKNKYNKFKCVINYNGTLSSKEFTIQNLDYTYDLEINSSEGTKFYFDNGSPDLTCIIKDNQENEIDYNANYSYFWSVTDSHNNYSIWEENVNKDEIGRSYIKDFPIKVIDNFATVKCAVYLDNIFIGAAAITLVNSLETEGTYSLVINNGDQIFQYDEYGTSPAAASSLTPITVLPLTFTVFDNLGNPIEDSVISRGSIEWQVANKNTMLKVQKTIQDEFIESHDDYTSYVQCLELPIDINDAYNLYYQNNTITLNVKYKDINLVAQTNFTFTKEGEIGTNGTNYICRIVPNTKSSFTEWPMLIDNSKTRTWNFTPIDTSGKAFKVQLFDGTEKIFEGVNSQNPFTTRWELLQNTYSGSIKDNAYMSITTDGIITLNNNAFTFDKDNPSSFASIIKCTVTYNGKSYYATMPFITFKKASDKDIKLKQNTGYHYVEYGSDGAIPKYIDAKSTYPFELEVRNASGNDISSNYTSNCSWESLGTIKTRPEGTTNWNEVKTNNLSIKDELDENNKKVKPTGLSAHAVPANRYINEGVTDIVMCQVGDAGTIYIPIHFYLNRYGMSALNDWDGNSIEINKDQGHILAPQIGAGKKSGDNSFTGLVMGVAKESNRQEATGLFGFNGGQRTLFLSADDGSAILGKAGNGQIVMDPSSGKGMIYSSNFWSEYNENGKPKTTYSYNSGANKYDGQNNGGMLIDLTTPRILFGTGNFRVDSNGFIYSKGGGSIAGWEISDDKLSKNNLTLDSGRTAIYSHRKSEFGNVSEGFYLGPDGISLGRNNGTNSPFQVNNEGYLIARSGTVGGATITSNSIYMENGTLGWGLYAHQGHAPQTHGGIAMNIGGNQLNIGGSRFLVYHDGTLKATNGEFSGTIHATSGDIGGWIINSNSIIGGRAYLNSSGSIGGASWSIDDNGNATFTNIRLTNGDYNRTGSNLIDFGGFGVNGFGNMWANSGSIGGWIIGPSGFSGAGLISGGSINGSSLDGCVINGGQINGSAINAISVGADAMATQRIDPLYNVPGLDHVTIPKLYIESELKVQGKDMATKEYADAQKQGAINEIKQWVTANFEPKS